MATNKRRARKTYKKPRTREDRRAGYYKRRRKKNNGNERLPRGPQQTMFLCTTPFDSNCCSGTANAKEKLRFHNCSDDVITCYGNYLVKQGYKFKSRREYINPETGSILVLSRRAMPCKMGKSAYLARHEDRTKIVMI